MCEATARRWTWEREREDCGGLFTCSLSGFIHQQMQPSETERRRSFNLSRDFRTPFQEPSD